MRMNKFFSVAVAALATAGIAFAAKKMVDQNGGLQSTLGKARKSAAVAIAWTTDVLTTLRDRTTGNDNDDFTGEHVATHRAA